MPRRSLPKASNGGGRTFTDGRRDPLRMPLPMKGQRWHARVKAHWASLTSEPFVEMWTPSDVDLAIRLCWMWQRLYVALEDPSTPPSALKSLSAEVRAVELSLGGSPAARASLRWNAAPARRSVSVSTRPMSMADLGL